MEYYNKMLCMTYEDLTPGVMQYETLKKLLARHNAEKVQRGGGEGACALVVWESLPKKYREKYETKYGDPAETMRKAMMKERMKLDTEARAFYESYTYYKNGGQTHLTEKLIDEYTINASVLGMLQRKMNDRNALRKALNAQSMSGAWKMIHDMSEKLCETYGHTLPKNLARLKDRMNAYKADGYGSLVSGKVGNQNTLKITEEVGDQIVALKRSRVPVYNDSQLFEKMNEICAERGWKPIKSQSGMTAWLNSEAVQPLWYDAVYGEQASRQRFGRKHKTALPTRRDSLWYGDGTKLNLYYKDEDGKPRTVQVYEVIDAATEVLLGYHISDTEDYEAQYNAYRMAVQVSGHKPYEIVHDNQGGHKKLDADGLFKKLCHIHRTTQTYNGESKTIESIFGRFQQQVLHKDWRFTGQNVTARKKSSRPNIEFIEANKDSLYTLDELKARYGEMRKEWNEMKHPGSDKSRMELYNESVNEEAQEVTVYDMIDMFWVFTQKMSTFTDQGIEITVKGRKRQYEVFSEPGTPDHEWRRLHTYQRFVVAYDPYDFGSVRLYSKDKDGSLRFERTAEPYMVIHRAIQDQNAEDTKRIRQEQTANMQDRIERQVAAKAIEDGHGTSPERHGLKTPKLKGVTKEVQRQIDRRTQRYSAPPDEYRLGRVTKKVSNMDWMETAEVRKIDERKTAGKM